MIEFVFGVALIVSYVLLFYNYHVTGRKALAYYALAWFSLSVHFFVPEKSVYIVGLAFFAFLVWLGNLRASEELLCNISYVRELRYFSAVPLAGLIFLFPEHMTYSMVVLAGSVAFSGIYLLLTRNESLRLMGILEMAFAVIVFLRGYYFTNQYIGLVTAVFAVVLAYVSIKTFLDSSFIGEFEFSDVKPELKHGLTMMPSVPDDILEGALVFSRVRKDRSNWFWITKLSEERAISPTNLARMLDMAVKFMKSASDLGKNAVIVIDGLEYLILENGFVPVMKFLSALRDYSLLNGATVILIGDDSFLDERERQILRKLFD